MIVAVTKRAKAGLIAMGLAACLSAQVFGQSPHDSGGVGAEGLIGRGTIPEERPSAAFSPSSGYLPAYVDYGPAYVSAPMIAPSRPLPVMAAPTPPVVGRGPSPSAAVNRATSPTVREPALVRINPYMGFHRGWLHGYWNVQDGSPGRTRDSDPARRAAGVVPTGVIEPGMGLGWGIPAWLIGPMAYRWGYFPFENPYLSARPAGDPGPSGFPDYSRPVDVVAPLPGETLRRDALLRFREAREAFRREDYTEALRRTDEALRAMPQDPWIHEFRAVTLIALHRYREAARVLYAVVAVVPGWDWTTMAKLYKHPETYTRQLRLLESYTDENPRSPWAHFLLAYEYLTTGYADSAADQLDEVAAIRPGDRLVARLARALRPPASRPAPSLASRTGEEGDLVGIWTARSGDETITLTIRAEGDVTWKVDDRGRIKEYVGSASYLDGILTLIQDQDNSMTATITWKDLRHFELKVLEAQPGDRGLSFGKSS